MLRENTVVLNVITEQKNIFDHRNLEYTDIKIDK